jgi:hypothetical protein
VYVHLRGAAGLREELFGTPHLYMLPAAGLMIAVTGLALRHLWRRWSDLGRRLAMARAAVDRAWRGHRTTPLEQPAAPTWSYRLVSLWLVVAPLQLVLYVLQESLEARSVHQAVPGLAVLWSDHWSATVVHLLTALVLCALAVRLTGGIVRRARALVVHERLLRWLLRRLAATRPVTGIALQSPLDRFGRQLWGRPPPAPVRP